MYRFLLALSLGMLALSYSSRLPNADEMQVMWVLLGAAITIAFRFLWGKNGKGLRGLVLNTVVLAFVGFLLGVLLASVRGQQMMAQQLPTALNGTEYLIEGEVVGLPQWRKDRWSFYIRPILVEAGDAHLDRGLANIRKIRLSWRPPKGLGLYHQLRLEAGDVRRFKVRLKRPRGLVNPGGFDYQAWLIRKRVGAHGYLLEPPSEKLEFVHSVDRFRSLLRERVMDVLPQRSDIETTDAYVLALLIGDKSGITQDQWSLLQKTGTLHLMAISGMHIGIAAFLGHFLGALMGRFANIINPRLTAKGFAALGAVSAAWSYSALAGFSLPTQRALLMLLVFYITQMIRRPQAGLYYFFCALVFVLLLDPLAAMDAGFWLSFGAVFCLLFAFAGRRDPRKIAALLKAQAILFVGLALPLSIITGSVSLVAPLANIVAIPLVSLMVVPGLFLSLLLMFLEWEVALANVLSSILWLLSCLSDFLTWVDELWLPSVWQVPMPLAMTPLIAAGIGALLFLLPKGIPGRQLGVLGFLPLCLSGTETQGSQAAPLKLTVLDVGQGLAVHIQTAQHHLLYDTGPSFGEQFNSGKNIILPYFLRHGIRELHSLVVSHEDNDHAGGAAAVSDAMDIRHEWRSSGLNTCHGARPWELDGVKFSFLGPRPDTGERNNNLSCVLLIRWREYSVLLAGDIGAAREQEIVAARPGDDFPVSLMLAPHHGSKTSSSYTWLYHWLPERVIFSAGFESRYGHPHADIVQRYNYLGAEQFNTAESGAISFEVDSKAANSLPKMRLQRVNSHRYWYADNKSIRQL